MNLKIYFKDNNMGAKSKIFILKNSKIVVSSFFTASEEGECDDDGYNGKILFTLWATYSNFR